MPRRELDSLDLTLNEIQNVRLQSLSADPATLEARIYYNTTTHSVRYYNGTAWFDVSTGSYSDEQAQDALAAAFAAGSQAVVTISYNDAANSFTLSIATGAITSAMILDGTITDTDVAAANKDGAAGTASLRTIGTGAAQAMAGNTTLSSIAAPTADVSLATHKLTNVVDGTATTDAATFGQLNAILEGKIGKDPVEVASTANLGLTGLSAIDGYTPVAGDRVLAKDQTSAAQNGLYVAAAGAWSRTADMNAGSEFKNGTVLVLNGTANKNKVFTESATVVTVGTDTVTFVQTSIADVLYTADETSLHLTGTVFSILTGSIVNAQIAAAAAIAYSKLALTGSVVNADIAAAAAIAYSKLALTGSVVNADIAAAAAIVYSKLSLTASLLAGDVGGTTASGTGVVSIARKWAGPTVGGATSEVLTHGLNTRDITVQVLNNATPWDVVGITAEATTVNTITLRSGAANIPAGYRVVVTG